MPSQRRYPRTARLNELVHQILADALERVDDDRLVLVTVMSVTVDPDLRNAHVLFESPEGAERDEEILEAFEELRIKLQSVVARQARLKRTPHLTFAPDEVERQAARVEDVLHRFGQAGD